MDLSVKVIVVNGITYNIPGNLRTGQWLFNNLPTEVRGIISGALWDPFFVDMSQWQLNQWVNDHLIFDDEDGRVIGLFHNNMILWEENSGPHD